MSISGITADMILRTLGPLFVTLLLLAGCGDGDIRKGCKNYCKCHRGERTESACRSQCTEKLSALKKRDRPQAKQIADCLAAKGDRNCGELAACVGDALK